MADNTTRQEMSQLKKSTAELTAVDLWIPVSYLMRSGSRSWAKTPRNTRRIRPGHLDLIRGQRLAAKHEYAQRRPATSRRVRRD